MKTITIQIGNSDDRLTQKDWASFVADVARAVESCPGRVHFAGASPGSEPWQNYCVVVEVESQFVELLRGEVESVRRRWRQDSVAWTEGETRFV